MGDYLFITKSNLTIDLFSFEQALHLFEPFVATNVSVEHQMSGCLRLTSLDMLVTVRWLNVWHSGRMHNFRFYFIIC